MIDFLEAAIKKSYPQKIDYLKSKVLKVGKRGLEDIDIMMDCQPGSNTPVLKKSSVRGPHLANPIEIFAGLLYFRESSDLTLGGDLEIYKWKNPDKKDFFDKLEIENKYVQKLNEIKYEDNTLVLFLNTIDSIHAVTPREVTSYDRKLVNFIGELSEDQLFKPVRKKKYIRRAFKKMAKMLKTY